MAENLRLCRIISLIWVTANKYPLDIFKIGIISDWIQNWFKKLRPEKWIMPKDMCLVDSHLFTYSILQYYHKMLKVATLFTIFIVLRQLTSHKMEPLSPGVIFIALLLLFKTLYWKLDACCVLCTTKYLVTPYAWKLLLKYLIGILEYSVHFLYLYMYILLVYKILFWYWNTHCFYN